MSDSDVYLSSATSTENCDTFYSSIKGEMEVVSMVQPSEGEPHAWNKDLAED